MTSQHRIPTSDNNNLPHPADDWELLTTNQTSKEEEMSVKSYTTSSTYGQKDPILNSSSSKRIARKLPPDEPDQKVSAYSSSLLSSKQQPLLLEGVGQSLSLVGPSRPTLPDFSPGTEDRGELGTLTSDSKFADASTVPHFNRAVGGKNQVKPFSDQQLTYLEQRFFQPRPADHEDEFDILSILSQVCVSEPSSITSLTPEVRQHLYGDTMAAPEPIFNNHPGVSTTTRPTIIPNTSSNRSSNEGGSGDGNATGKTSRSGNPRSILNERYQKKYNRSFKKSDFISIRDSSQGDHIPTFSSVFVCPESGECFMSGELLSSSTGGNNGISKNANNKGAPTMNWYTTKKNAEFAAAGRAEDNFRFRSTENPSRAGSIPVEQFCMESPYVAEEEPDIYTSFLQAIPGDGWSRERVETLKQKAAAAATTRTTPTGTHRGSYSFFNEVNALVKQKQEETR